MIKRLFLFICSLILAAVTVLTPIQAAALGSNLVANPSVETNVSGKPSSWASDKWGTNTVAFSYQSTGSHSGTYSLKTKMTARTSGDAKWYFTPVTAKPNTSYTFSDWYKSTVKSSIDVEITTTSNTKTYLWLAGPASSTNVWKQANYTFTTPANTAKVTVFHSISAVGEITTDDYNLATTSGVAATTPQVTMTAPANASTVSGTTAVSASVSDTTPISGVQFKLDGVNLGAIDTTAPYSSSWNTTTAANGSHTLTAVATNTSGGTGQSSSTVTVNNPTTVPSPPTVSLSAPTAGSTVSGTTTLSANASDKNSITNVQFILDGANIGAPDTTAPYSLNWDTTSVVNGTHSIRAKATNADGLSTTTAAINVTVNNPVTPPSVTNLIANDSVESGAVTPDGWISDGWGTNNRSFSYEPTGHSGAHSIKTTISTYTSGDSKWYFNAVPVTAGKTYNYSNWYKSSANTELDAMVTMSDGSLQYYWLGTFSPSSTNWQKASAQFTAPAGAVRMTVFQVIYSVGYVQTDDFILSENTPSSFNRAIVSLTFDDGWRSIYTNGLPVLNKYGLVSTQYLNSQPITGGYPDYMTYQMVKDFSAGGHELAWHTRTHADITQLTTSALDTELTIPTGFLTSIGQPASSFTNFATPYGAYNASSLTEVKKFYGSHRSTDVGYNTPDNFDIYNIKVQNITNTTTPAQVKAWVDQAIATKSWLVIVYHEVDAGAADPTYAVTPANLDQELSYIKQSGVIVKTIAQALSEVAPQL